MIFSLKNVWDFPLTAVSWFIFIVTLLDLWIKFARPVMKNQLPGPPTIPILGNAYYGLLLTKQGLFEKLMDDIKFYDDVVCFWIAHELLVFVSNPDDCKLILESHEHIEKSRDYQFLQPWLGDGLIINSGETWKIHRKLIAPAFHINILKSYIPIFNEHSKHLVINLMKEVGQEFDVQNHLKVSTLNMLMETAMGSKKIVDDEDCLRYTKSIMEMTHIFGRRIANIFVRFEPFFTLSGTRKRQNKLISIMHGITNRILEERLNNLEAESSNKTQQATDDYGKKRRLAFLDLLIETSKSNPDKISRDQIMHQVETFMVLSFQLIWIHFYNIN